MKRTRGLAMLAVSMAISAVAAAGLALIYESEEAVTSGRSWPALVTDAGAAMPSESALASANSMLYGDADGLFRGSIARLDNDLNLAIIRKGERVGNQDLQTAHSNRWKATSAFLQLSTTVAGSLDVVTPVGT